MTHQILEKIQKYLKGEIANGFFYSEFVESLKFIKEDEKNILVGCTNKFAEDVLNNEWASKISSLILNGKKVVFVVSHQPQQENKKIISNLNKQFTFDNFFVYEFNKSGYNAVQSVLKSVFWNPIYICGGVGLGKTHLLHAVGNEYTKQHPDKNVLYVTSDDFVREVYGSLIKNDQSIELLKEKYAQVDLLLFDDVEFLSKKEKINEILFYIFNKNINENKIIIFTSDSTPSELNNFDDRMISRFNSGLCVILQTPSNEDIKNLFLKKIASVNKDISFTEEAITYVIHRYSKDVRQLEGFIQNLLFWIINENKANCVITLDDCKSLLHQFSSDKWKKNGYDVDPNIIIEEICKFYNVDSNSIKSKSKKKNVVKIRSICMHALRYKFNMPFEQIGVLFLKHHTTIIDAVENINNLIKKDEDLKRVLINLYKKI